MSKRRSPTDRRPRTPDILSIRVTQDEKREIILEANVKGISISDVARRRMFAS